MSIQLELPVVGRRQVDVIHDLSDYGSPQTVRLHASVPTQQRPHRSVAQPAERALRRIAAARIRATALHREERSKLTPEQVADRMTSLADARIALCAAQGNSLDDIDPASGYSLSRESYERARQSWRNQAKQPGWNECYRPDLEKAIAFWSERRPEFTEGDDWLAGLVDRCRSSEGDA
jgi:hypothetical protein